MLMLISALASAAISASPYEPHFHQGKLQQYEIGPPSLLLSRHDEAELEEGKAIMQVVVNPDSGTRRLMMVRDIDAPSSVVLDRILDLENYPRMVKGVDRVAKYMSSTHVDGVEETRAEYDIHALHLKYKYYMLHKFDPQQRCLIFHLDYSRQSDIDDSVGYWYVLPRAKTSCRVFYSCDTKLRGWVPPPVYALLGKTALKQATTWVNSEACKQWTEMQREQSRAGGFGEATAKAVTRLRDAWHEVRERSRDGVDIREWWARRRLLAARMLRPPSVPAVKGMQESQPVHTVGFATLPKLRRPLSVVPLATVL